MNRPSKRLIEEGFYQFKKTCTEGNCWVRGCRKSQKSDRCMCHMHEMRRWRSLNKLASSFCTLRDHAKGRHLAFDLTPDYWRGLTDGFCFFNHDNPDNVLTIDRIDGAKGYLMGNLQVVSVSLNVIKGNRERHLPAHVQAILERDRAEAQHRLREHLVLGEEPPDDTGLFDDSEDAPADEFDLDGEDPF